MHIRTTWNDVMFGSAQVDEPSIYIVMFDGECKYVGKSMNVGSRFVSHFTRDCSPLHLITERHHNPIVDIFGLHDACMVAVNVLDEWCENCDAYGAGRWWIFFRQLLLQCESEVDKLSLLEHFFVFAFRPRMNRNLPAKNIMHRSWRDLHSGLEFSVFWEELKFNFQGRETVRFAGFSNQ